MTTFNKLIFTGFMLMAMMLWAQTTTNAGLSVGTTVATVSACQAVTGASFTICTVPGDGIYVLSGSGAPAKLFPPSQAPGVSDYRQLTNRPTTISCSTSSQSNSGFTASGCSLN